MPTNVILYLCFLCGSPELAFLTCILMQGFRTLQIYIFVSSYSIMREYPDKPIKIDRHAFLIFGPPYKTHYIYRSGFYTVRPKDDKVWLTVYWCPAICTS